jgi:hypothetical protein
LSKGYYHITSLVKIGRQSIDHGIFFYFKEFDTKNEAMGYEKWLKTGVGRDFIKTLAP